MMEESDMCDYQAILKEAIAENPNNDKWDNSVYGGIKLVSNTAVGKVGQTFIRKICELSGVDCVPALTERGNEAYTSPWDLKINGVTFEVKTASEDVGGGYQFNHVRLHRKYQALLCVGISPNDIFFNVWTKADVATGKAGNLVSMEKGGASDFKLSKRPVGMKKIELLQNAIYLLKIRY